MDFGLFLEFPRREGATHQQAFEECFALVDEAEARGVDSVWVMAGSRVMSGISTGGRTAGATMGSVDPVFGEVDR